VATAFESQTTSAGDGPTINSNAEYDALPGIGHGCGHNLISTASVVAYISLAHLVRKNQVSGTIQLI